MFFTGFDTVDVTKLADRGLDGDRDRSEPREWVADPTLAVPYRGGSTALSELTAYFWGEATRGAHMTSLVTRLHGAVARKERLPRVGLLTAEKIDLAFRLFRD